MRDLHNLNQILEEEVQNGLRSQSNMPVHSRIRNVSKNRKMTFSNIKRYFRRELRRNEADMIEKRNLIKQSEMKDPEVLLNNEHRILSDAEQSALDVLLGLENIVLSEMLSTETVEINVNKISKSETLDGIAFNLNNVCPVDVLANIPLEELLPLGNVYLSADEICALDALIDLYEGSCIGSPKINSEALPNLKKNICFNITDENQNGY